MTRKPLVRSVFGCLIGAMVLSVVPGCAMKSASDEMTAAESAPPEPRPRPPAETVDDGSQNAVEYVDDASAPPPQPPPPPPPPLDGPPRNGHTANGHASACRGMPKLTLQPPAPSAAPYMVNTNLFRGPGATLQDAADKLLNALQAREYHEHGFYCVPGWFALATRIERIREDRRPWPGDARWEAGKAPLLRLQDGFSLKRIVDALFRADPGRYRMIVFYVTYKPIAPRPEGPGPDYAGLPQGGESELPGDFDQMPFGPNHRVRAYIYEFRRPSVSASAEFVKQTLPTYTHLDRAGLLAGLNQ